MSSAGFRFFFPEVFQTGWFLGTVLIHLSPRESLGAKDGVLIKAIFLKEYEGFNIENVKKPMQRSFSEGQEV